LVSSKHVLPLANTTADSKDPLITIPSDIIRAAFRAISARKRCTAYFTSKTDGDESTAKEDQGHSYFTPIMEETVMVLQRRFALSAGESEEAVHASSSSPLETSVGSDKLSPTIIDY